MDKKILSEKEVKFQEKILEEEEYHQVKTLEENKSLNAGKETQVKIKTEKIPTKEFRGNNLTRRGRGACSRGRIWKDFDFYFGISEARRTEEEESLSKPLDEGRAESHKDDINNNNYYNNKFRENNNNNGLSENENEKGKEKQMLEESKTLGKQQKKRKTKEVRKWKEFDLFPRDDYTREEYTINMNKVVDDAAITGKTIENKAAVDKQLRKKENEDVQCRKLETNTKRKLVYLLSKCKLCCAESLVDSNYEGCLHISNRKPKNDKTKEITRMKDKTVIKTLKQYLAQLRREALSGDVIPLEDDKENKIRVDEYNTLKYYLYQLEDCETLASRRKVLIENMRLYISKNENITGNINDKDETNTCDNKEEKTVKVEKLNIMEEENSWLEITSESEERGIEEEEPVNKPLVLVFIGSTDKYNNNYGENYNNNFGKNNNNINGSSENEKEKEKDSEEDCNKKEETVKEEKLIIVEETVEMTTGTELIRIEQEDGINYNNNLGRNNNNGSSENKKEEEKESEECNNKKEETVLEENNNNAGKNYNNNFGKNNNSNGFSENNKEEVKESEEHSNRKEEIVKEEKLNCVEEVGGVTTESELIRIEQEYLWTCDNKKEGNMNDEKLNILGKRLKAITEREESKPKEERKIEENDFWNLDEFCDESTDKNNNNKFGKNYNNNLGKNNNNNGSVEEGKEKEKEPVEHSKGNEKEKEPEKHSETAVKNEVENERKDGDKGNKKKKELELEV